MSDEDIDPYYTLEGNKNAAQLWAVSHKEEPSKETPK
jgi:hypothetical protein